MELKEKFKIHREVVDSITTLDDTEKELLYSALNIHGHFCGGMPMGYLAGLAGLKALGTTRELSMDKEVIVYVGDHHAGGCFADGVQFSTGCTFGKGIMSKDPRGKWAYMLIDKKNKKAVKVTVRPEIIQAAFNAPFITKFRIKGIPPAEVDQDVAKAAFLGLFNKKLEEIVKVEGPFDYDPGKGGSCFNLAFCDKCGDAVAENYLRVEDEKKVCLDCFTFTHLIER